jgi:hypothetical protein
MKQSKVHGGLLVAALVSVMMLAVAPVSAHRGSETNSQLAVTDDTSTSSDDGTADQGSGDADASTNFQMRDTKRELNRIRAEARSHLAELRAGKAERTLAQRQKVCENREKAVNNKLKAFNAVADKHLTRLNSVFDKLQAYQTEQQVAVEDYEQLVTAATANQQIAKDATAALKDLTVEFDCTSNDPASTLGAVKEAAAEARDALKTYRTSLKNIVVAFAQADKTDDTTTEGGAE